MSEKCPECGEEFDSYKAMRVHQHRTNHMKRPWRDEERLRRLYVEKRMSAYEIAEELDCGASTIYNALDDFGIERRSNSEAKKTKRRKQPAAYRTCPSGYEEVLTSLPEGQKAVRVSRLAAVAWNGFEAVKDAVVHHENGVPWDNRECNLTVVGGQDKHAKLHAHERERDNNGRFV